MIAIPPQISSFLPAGFLDRYLIELLLAITLVLLITLIVSFFHQRSRYRRLKRWIKQGKDHLKSQEMAMGNLDKQITKIKKSQEGLDYWSTIRGELGELSKLPSIEEKDDEIIIKTQISKLKKEDTDVTASDDEIKVSVYADRIPLKCAYALPAKINPNKLVITYKGNTLEIRAPKV